MMERLFKGMFFYAAGFSCDHESECGFREFEFKSNSESMEEIIAEASEYLRKENSCYPTVYIQQMNEVNPCDPYLFYKNKMNKEI